MSCRAERATARVAPTLSCLLSTANSALPHILHPTILRHPTILLSSLLHSAPTSLRANNYSPLQTCPHLTNNHPEIFEALRIFLTPHGQALGPAPTLSTQNSALPFTADYLPCLPSSISGSQVTRSGNTTISTSTTSWMIMKGMIPL